MKRIALAGALVALLALTGSANAAETVPLGYKQDMGDYPAVYFLPDTVERPLYFYVTYSATPTQALDIEYSVHCTRGPESVSSAGEATILPPHTMPLLVTMPNPDSCWITASAEPAEEGYESPGTIRIDATATREPPPPYWQNCQRPRWLKRGSLRVHGERLPCRTATRIATRVWRQPERTGHYVRIGRFRCVRSGRGEQARVQCSRGSDRFKLVGKLRR